MKRRNRAPDPFPPSLRVYDPAAWADEFAFRMARWNYWREHQAEMPGVDPVQLLIDRREARLNRLTEGQSQKRISAGDRHLRPV